MNTAPLILFFKAEQFGLFGATSTVSGYVNPKGKFVAPYQGTRHHAVKKPKHPLSGHLFAQADPSVASSHVQPEPEGKLEPIKAESKPEPAPRTYRTPQARALAEAMQQGDLRAALAVLQPLSFKDAHDTALYAGLAVSNAQSKAQLLTQLQEQLLAASKKKTDGYGLHTKAFPARARMLFFKAAA